MKLTFEWSKFDPAVGYEKAMQDIKLKNGDIVTMLWPNAGIWNICQPDGNEKYANREIKSEDVEYVRRNAGWHID